MRTPFPATKHREIGQSECLQTPEESKGNLGASHNVYYERNTSTVPLPCLVLQVLKSRCAVLYDLSTGSGRSPDSISTVLQILAAGVILSVAREARARAIEAQPAFMMADPDVVTWLRDPIFVVGLPPSGWEQERYYPGTEQTPRSRVWSFVYTDYGIRVNRSKGLTIRQMIEYLRAGVY